MTTSCLCVECASLDNVKTCLYSCKSHGPCTTTFVWGCDVHTVGCLLVDKTPEIIFWSAEQSLECTVPGACHSLDFIMRRNCLALSLSDSPTLYSSFACSCRTAAKVICKDHHVAILSVVSQVSPHGACLWQAYLPGGCCEGFGVCRT